MQLPLSSQELKRMVARNGEDLIKLLEATKDYIADARNGEWNTESRKAAIKAVDEVIVNPLKAAFPRDKSSSDDGLDGMI